MSDVLIDGKLITDRERMLLLMALLDLRISYTRTSEPSATEIADHDTIVSMVERITGKERPEYWHERPKLTIGSKPKPKSKRLVVLGA
jgi:hypothetical protein